MARSEGPKGPGRGGQGVEQGRKEGRSPGPAPRFASPLPHLGAVAAVGGARGRACFPGDTGARRGKRRGEERGAGLSVRGPKTGEESETTENGRSRTPVALRLRHRPSAASDHERAPARPELELRSREERKIRGDGKGRRHGSLARFRDENYGSRAGPRWASQRRERLLSSKRTSLYWCRRMLYLQNPSFLLSLDKGAPAPSRKMDKSQC
ncbi:uncharacterized protein LOC124970649 [Sciurus carolinensis]|uniref:uncharacterized protein LOC124970649 n=1 Tax=Sciurus carolinensis TaxID=30640 RepID=UPI001FB1B706|nr:uncharacterized protein LOC124970649 [Sciurus carolinensis]